MNARRKTLAAVLLLAVGLTLLVLSNYHNVDKYVDVEETNARGQWIRNFVAHDNQAKSKLRSLRLTDFVSDEDFEWLIQNASYRQPWSSVRILANNGSTANVDLMYQNALMISHNVSSRRYETQVVPNIVHYIWFGNKREFNFLYYLSVLSAHKIQRPKVIMFHHNVIPLGGWWDRLTKEVPLTMVPRNPPQDIFGQPLPETNPFTVYHQGDLTKLEVLMEHGGIYIDFDVLILRHLNPLLHYDVTLGQEKLPKFIAGIIIARRKAHFLTLWYESYKNNYIKESWDYNCAKVPYFLHLVYPRLLHVEPSRLTTPDWTERHLLLEQAIDWRGQGLYVIHAMSHAWGIMLTPDTIRNQNTTLSQAATFIYSLTGT